MFERYRPRARRAIFFARYDAGRFGAPQIETEHLLLGIAREDEPLLSRLLTFGATDASIRSQVTKRTPIGDGIPISVDLPLSDACKRILAFAAEEADKLGHSGIGTEHLVLGLLREPDGFAAQMLIERGAEPEAIRAELARHPSDPGGGEEKPASLFASLIEKTRLAVSSRTDPPHPGSLLAGFERYTEKARRSVFFARYEAHQSGAPAIEPHHLLLGILREMEMDRYRFLGSEISLGKVREQLSAYTGATAKPPSGVDLPLAELTRLALDLGAEEAGQTGWTRISPEHLLLGLLRIPDCLAARILFERGADPVRIRQVLSGEAGDPTLGENRPA
jgi:ATP-dependent Clp protease ATP-binding subunit ClpA